LIFSGTLPGQGALLARNYTGHHTRVMTLGQTTPWVNFSWALVETNYDFFSPNPYPTVDPRREVIAAGLGKLGQEQGATIDGMLSILSTPSTGPNQNGVLNIGTIFTVIMVPSNGTHQSYLRNWKGCCS
jgi:hypothetical protein